MKRITLSDVARDAGVSKTTVSMVLNADPRVAEATRERVQDSIAGLGYIYDRTAASLRSSRSQALGIVVTQLTNPYFAEFAEGIQAELDEQGMDVLLGVSGEDPQRQGRLLRSMSARRVDGIVVIPARGTTSTDLETPHVPLLLLARRVDGVEADYVGGDNTTGAEHATTHLISAHGCTRMAFVGGFEDSSARQERHAGFLRALTSHGLTVRPEHQPTSAPSRHEAREVARAVLSAASHSRRESANDSARDSRPDGILCFNDVVALGVIDALHEYGMRPGADVRVIGFDDIQAAASARPALASVSVSGHNAGRRAAQLLLARIRGEHNEVRELVLAAELKPRETCGCTDEREELPPCVGQ